MAQLTVIVSPVVTKPGVENMLSAIWGSAEGVISGVLVTVLVGRGVAVCVAAGGTVSVAAGVGVSVALAISADWAGLATYGVAVGGLNCPNRRLTVTTRLAMSFMETNPFR